MNLYKLGVPECVSVRTMLLIFKHYFILKLKLNVADVNEMSTIDRKNFFMCLNTGRYIERNVIFQGVMINLFFCIQKDCEITINTSILWDPYMCITVKILGCYIAVVFNYC